MRKTYIKPDLLQVVKLNACVLEASGSSGGTGGGDSDYTPFILEQTKSKKQIPKKIKKIGVKRCKKTMKRLI